MAKDPLYDFFDRQLGEHLKQLSPGTSIAAYSVELGSLALLGLAYGGLYVAFRNPIVAASVLASGVAILACWPWLRNRVLCVWTAARWRRRWDRAVHHCGLTKPVAVRRVKPVATGHCLYVRVGRGMSFPQIAAKREELAAELGVRAIRVDRDEHNAGTGTVTLVTRNPVMKPVSTEWPALYKTKFSIWDRIPFAVDEHGRTVEFSLMERNLLIGGVQGAGKTVAMSIPIAVAALADDADLLLVDGKVGIDFFQWESCAKQVAYGPAEAVALLQEVYNTMQQRWQELRKAGRRQVERSDPWRLQFVAIDELSVFTRAGKRSERDAFVDLLREILSLGRAAGIRVVAATQRPSATVVPTEIRELFQCRYALRSMDAQSSDMILGEGWARRGANAQMINSERKGTGLFLFEEALPTLCRNFYLTEDHIRSLVVRAQEWS